MYKQVLAELRGLCSPGERICMVRNKDLNCDYQPVWRGKMAENQVLLLWHEVVYDTGEEGEGRMKELSGGMLDSLG